MFLFLHSALDISQLAKMLKKIPYMCPCHKIYRVEAAGLSFSNDTKKNYKFCEYVKFVVIS